MFPLRVLAVLVWRPAAGRGRRGSSFCGESCVRDVMAPSASRRSAAPKEHSGGDSAGAPPLPIPNREVKPGCADGPAQQCGRVGSRRFLFMWVPRRPDGLPGNSFFCARHPGACLTGAAWRGGVPAMESAGESICVFGVSLNRHIQSGLVIFFAEQCRIS